MWTYCHGNEFVSQSLPSNGSMHYIASYQCTTISSPPRAVPVNSFPAAQFSWKLLLNCSCCCLLKTAHPKHLPDKVPVVYVYYHHRSSSQCRQKFREWSMLLHLWLLSCCLQSLLLFWWRLTPPQCPDTRFSNTDARLYSSFHNLQYKSLPEDPAYVLSLPRC